eukprot:m.28697 g.28697  ORF g.28697 m.28697 type:complete len:527 (-) comp6584_c0_seq1:1494-3074(-)
MYTPGEWAYAMLPTTTRLPMLDMASPGFLLRNFSALGFSCDNWLNETVTLLIRPIELHHPSSNVSFTVRTVDDFKRTAALWESDAAKVVAEPASSSGFALEITCQANTSGVCGPISAKKGCPVGCVPDGGGWCQAVATTVVNRRASSTYPLPTEDKDGSPLSVLEYDAIGLWWKVSPNYRPLPLGSAQFPIGVQTTDYPPFSNLTWTYFGNEVAQRLGEVRGRFPTALQTTTKPWSEVLGEGEFWPQVKYTEARVQDHDLGSTIVIDRGYFTEGTATARQVVALAEGPVIVIDTVMPDDVSTGWSGGPSWSVIAGAAVGQNIHDRLWPEWWSRPNVTDQGKNWAEFYGFQNVYLNEDLTDRRLVVWMSGDCGDGHQAQFGLTRSPDVPPSDCAAVETCPLYPSWYAWSSCTLAKSPATFISVLYPHAGVATGAAVASSVHSELSDGHARVTLVVGGVPVRVEIDLADRTTSQPPPWVVVTGRTHKHESATDSCPRGKTRATRVSDGHQYTDCDSRLVFIVRIVDGV